tara:strand:- start:9 stop:2366 length:2358 start_codon:yes stop_codon:yes gene_type:complete
MVEYITKNKLIERDDSGKVNYLLTARNIGAKLLGTYDEAKRAESVGIEVGERYRDDFQRAEDTARHGIFHGLLLDEKGKMNMLEKLGFNYMNLKKDEDETGIKASIKNLIALENTGEESIIDVNNNKFSVALRRQMIAEGNPSEEDFVDRVVNIVQDLRKGKESPEINGFKLKLSLGLLDEPIRKRYKDNILGGPTPYSDELNPAPNVGVVESTKIPPKRPKELEFNKGGIAMEEQMELFGGMGGLKDDGMNRDPISGNEVPSGSMAEEVRDDIPAQLSDGEYVVPADVVRFFGVKFFEDLRMQAKMGLAQMEKSGRIGGEPIEEEEEVLNPEDEQAIRIMMMDKGGVIKAAEGFDFSQDAASKADPLKQFRPFIGASYFDAMNTPSTDEIIKGLKDGIVNYYHPDGMVQPVQYKDGKLVNPSDEQYTKGDWSTIPPAQKKQDTSGTISFSQDDERESSNREKNITTSSTPSKSIEDRISTADLAKEVGGIALYSDKEKTKPLVMTRTDYINQLKEYDRLKLGEGDDPISFQEYHNLPVMTKVQMSFGKKYSQSDIQEILKNRTGPLGGIIGMILNPFLLKLGKAEGSSERFEAQTPEEIMANKNPLEKLALGDASDFMKTVTDAKGNKTEEVDVDKYYKAIGEKTPLGTTRADRFLLGLRKDGTIFKGKRDELGNAEYEKADAGTLSRLEKNRQDVQRDALKNFQKESDRLAGLRDTRAAEERAGSGQTGDLDTVAQNVAFDQQMADAQRVARGFEKGGLASKPKIKPKRKKNTKGLGTKPKAT